MDGESVSKESVLLAHFDNYDDDDDTIRYCLFIEYLKIAFIYILFISLFH